MPLYEYECQSCGRFEVLQSFSEKPLKTCPTCSEKGIKVAVERMVSAPAFHLKGSGWYKTDYATTSSKTPKGASDNKGSSDSSGGSDNKPESTAKGGDGGTTTAPSKACRTGCGCH